MKFDDMMIFEYSAFEKSSVKLPVGEHLAGTWFYVEIPSKEGIALLSLVLRHTWVPRQFPKKLEAGINDGNISLTHYLAVRTLIENNEDLEWR